MKKSLPIEKNCQTWLAKARKSWFQWRMRAQIVQIVIDTYGTARAVGEACGITGQAVSQWDKVPIEHVFTIERDTGIPREVLRPDVYGAPRPRPRRRGVMASAAA
jgi:DNA-binding transcriptional regulator YdaS (Cro superfamily)